MNSDPTKPLLQRSATRTFQTYGTACSGIRNKIDQAVRKGQGFVDSIVRISQFVGFVQRRLSAKEHLEMLDVAKGKPAAKRSQVRDSDYARADFDLGKKSISFNLHPYILSYSLSILFPMLFSN